MVDATVVYYTGNTEDEAFEAKIRRALVEAIGGRLPLISVSQKPLTDCGENICVGLKGAGDHNAFRQLQIGMQAATTPYIIAAEADTLYPPEYFDLRPLQPHCYRYPNVWVLHQWIGFKVGTGFWFKGKQECAQMAPRDYWLEKMHAALTQPDHVANLLPDGWGPAGLCAPLVFGKSYDVFPLTDDLRPVVSIKTGRGLRRWTYVKPNSERQELPLWGRAEDLRARLFGRAVAA